MALAIALAALGGLLVGSFLNVVAYRLPRGESLVAAALALPAAAARSSRADRQHPGRLVAGAARALPRAAAAPISARYPLVELRHRRALRRRRRRPRTTPSRIVLGLLLVTALVPITLIDLDHRHHPQPHHRARGGRRARRRSSLLDPDFLPEALIAGVAGGGFFLLAALLYPRGMGMGDVKLAGVLGLYLGPRRRARRSSSR